MTLALSKKCLKRDRASAILRDEAGMATGTVMIIAVLMASVALSILAMNSLNSGRDIRYALYHSMLEVIHHNLYAFGQNDAAWRATYEYNYSLAYTPKKFECLKNGSDCVIYSSPGVQFVEEISLRYPTGGLTGTSFYNPSRLGAENNRDGFRLDGSVCDYDQAPPISVSDGCLLHVTVQWRPFCISDCKIGPNKLIFDLIYSTPEIDEQGYSIGNKNFFLPAFPQGQSGSLPIYNPYR